MWMNGSLPFICSLNGCCWAESACYYTRHQGSCCEIKSGSGLGIRLAVNDAPKAIEVKVSWIFLFDNPVSHPWQQSWYPPKHDGLHKKRLSHCRTSLPLCFVISLSCRVHMWGVWPSSGWGVVQVLHVCSTKNKNHEKKFFWRVWRHFHRILLQKFPTIRQCSKYETPYTFCTHSRWDANSCMTKYTNQRWIRVIDSLEHRFPPKRKGG